MKMVYEIRPNEGLGPIDLQALRDDVRATVGEVPTEVARTKLKYPMDFFRAAALQVEYGADGRCVSIQATARAAVLFQGQHLIGRPFKDVRRWLEGMDPGVSVDGAGLTSRMLGVGLYAGSALKEPEAPVEAVIVFVPGYYESAKEGTL